MNITDFGIVKIALEEICVRHYKDKNLLDRARSELAKIFVQEQAKKRT